MFINEHTAIYTNRILLVPYSQHHVTTYHDWMQDPDIRAATASEPLSIEEEYAMQQSWRSDSDKLTFILSLTPPSAVQCPERVAEIAGMIGDVNMFISIHEEDDSKLSLVGELELMIASKNHQRKGLGRSALLTFLYYVLQHEKELIGQYPDRKSLGSNGGGFDYFVVKISENNGRSLNLFEGLGFKKTSTVPNFFGEYELRRYGLCVETVDELLSEHGVCGYQEIEYANSDTALDAG